MNSHAHEEREAAKVEWAALMEELIAHGYVQRHPIQDDAYALTDSGDAVMAALALITPTDNLIRALGESIHFQVMAHAQLGVGLRSLWEEEE